MSQPSVLHHSFVLERSFPVPPSRIFAAFADPAQKRRWFVESGHNPVEHYQMDFRAGGTELARIRLGPGTPVAGMICTNEIRYLHIVPGARIVFASTMAIGEQCISASLVTFELLPTAAGTDLIFTHQAAFFEGADGPAMRQEGWSKLMDRLGAEFAG